MPASSFRLTIAAEALKAAVHRACSVSPDKATIPILGHVLLRADRNGLAVTGTDLDRQATARAEADVDEPGAITVTAKTIEDVTAKLPAGAEVSLTADAVEGIAVLKCGRSRFKLLGLDPDDFPEFAPEAMGQGFPYRIELAGKTLADVLTRVRFAISTEETRYYLGGVYVHVVEVDGEPRLRLVATDGHRLARIDTAHAEGLDPAMPGVIIPRTVVGEFIKLAKEADAGNVVLELSRTLVRLTVGAGALTSKLIDGTFPDYQRVIPTEFLREATAPTLALIECLERVRVMADAKTKGVRLALSADLLTVSLRRPYDASEAHDEVDVQLDGPGGVVDFNARFLAEILAQTGGDRVRLKLGDDMAPAVIGDKLAEGLFVLMPLRPGSVDASAPAEG